MTTYPIMCCISLIWPTAVCYVLYDLPILCCVLYDLPILCCVLYDLPILCCVLYDLPKLCCVLYDLPMVCCFCMTYLWYAVYCMTCLWYSVYCMTLPNGVLKLQAEEEAGCEVLDVVHAHHVVRSSAHHKRLNKKLFTCKTGSLSYSSTVANSKMWVFFTRSGSHDQVIKNQIP